MAGENLTRIEAQERAELISVSDYHVELDLTTSDKTFRSISTVHFSTHKPGCHTFIDLIAQSVERIELNGEELPLGSYADSRIPLPHLQENNTLTVDATCIYSHSGEGLHRAIDPADGQVYLYSQFEVPDARRMYAVFEQPDLKADFTFTVTAPAHWHVFSVSPEPQPQQVEGKDHNTGSSAVARWEFTPTEHISSYLTCIVAGPYRGETSSCTSIDGREIPMGAYCRESVLEHFDPQTVMDITKQGMAFYEKEFKQPYPFRKYDQIFVPEYNMGAMEHPGCVTILDDYVFTYQPTQALVERRAITILHELAHMWFGDLVTMKWWNDLWLNESFAEYMSHVAAFEATEYKQAWLTFNASEKVWAQAQDQLPSTHPIAAVINDLEDTMVNFDGITYGKGASVFQQLVAYVGWNAFIEGVQKYLAKKAWGNATLNDLLVELSAASGRDMESWSKVWLEEAGINTFCPELSLNDDGSIASLAVRQISDGLASLRPHRVRIGGFDLNEQSGKIERVLSSELDIDGEVTLVPDFAQNEDNGKARPAIILINDGDLAYAKVRMDSESLAFASEHINDFEDHLARTLVLNNAWDMLRDADMPAHDFVPLALRALETESHGTVLRYLLSELLTAVNLYSDPQHRAELQAQAADGLEKLLKAAEPGSDRQLQLATNFALAAHSAEHLDWLESWLDNNSQAVPEGLRIDTGMRWTVANALASAGRLTADDVETIRTQYDNTAKGAASAAEAAARIPDAAQLETAWDLITSGKAVNSVQRYAAMGFAQNDPKLLAPFVQRWFDALHEQWADRSKEIAENMIKRSFPVKLTGLTDEIGADLIAVGDAWIQAHKESEAPALVRLVSEVLDGAHRAKKAQERDAQ